MKNPASALLVAVLIMGLLISFTLGVSLLVLGDMRAFRTFTAGVQARYAAEGMNELGLKLLKDHLPGFEPVLEDYPLQSGALADLTVTARGNTIPCEEETWRRLNYEESIQLPLFSEISDGTTVQTNEFFVEFFIGDENETPISLSERKDVLRWRITGLRNQPQVPEAISEFIPVVPSNMQVTSFGSVLGDASDQQYGHAKYVDSVTKVFVPNYPIRQFLENHTLNYLTLTHAGGAYADYPLYFKLHAVDQPAPCEYASLSAQADVERETVKKILQTKVREGENLPVFDFVIYHTSGTRAPEEEVSTEIPDFVVDGLGQ